MKMKMHWLIAALIVTALNVTAADKETRKERREVREAGDRQETKRDIDKRIAAINQLDNDQTAKMAGLAHISKETAVPVAKIQDEHKEHPNVGLAGLFMAHELAVKTHKPVEQFLTARKGGKTWTELARANGLSLDELDGKLTRIENAMRGAK